MKSSMALFGGIVEFRVDNGSAEFTTKTAVNSPADAVHEHVSSNEADFADVKYLTLGSSCIYAYRAEEDHVRQHCGIPDCLMSNLKTVKIVYDGLGGTAEGLLRFLKELPDDARVSICVADDVDVEISWQSLCPWPFNRACISHYTDRELSMFVSIAICDPTTPWGSIDDDAVCALIEKMPNLAELKADYVAVKRLPRGLKTLQTSIVSVQCNLHDGVKWFPGDTFLSPGVRIVVNTADSACDFTSFRQALERALPAGKYAVRLSAVAFHDYEEDRGRDPRCELGAPMVEAACNAWHDSKRCNIIIETETFASINSIVYEIVYPFVSYVVRRAYRRRGGSVDGL